MKYLIAYLLLFIGILPLHLQSQTEFITTWTVSATYPSITFEVDPLFRYNYSIDWGDGTQDINVQADKSHLYLSRGTYQIEITGIFPKFQSPDVARLNSIDQWGTIKWRSMREAFKGAVNLSSITKFAPDLKLVTDMHEMFRNCKLLNSSIASWDVSTVTEMSGMFQDAEIYDKKLSTWDVSNVTTMLSMFENAKGFNQDISGWEVDSVLNLAVMFRYAISFNQDISGWNVTSSPDLSGMFDGATTFNQNLDSWDVSNALYLDAMFDNTAISMSNYDSILISWASLSGLNNDINLGAQGLTYCDGTSARQILIETYNWNITGDSGGCPFITTWKTDNPGSSSSTSITIPTTGSGYNYSVDWDNDGTFDTIGVTGTITHDYGVADTFQVAIKGLFPRIYFNNTGDKEKILSIDQWGDIEWSSMAEAFYGCTNLRYTATDRPNLENVFVLNAMFRNCSVFNGDVSNWDLSSINQTNFMFANANQFNQNLSSWDMSSVFATSQMFLNATIFDQNIGDWDLTELAFAHQMLSNSGMSKFNYDYTLIGWASKSPFKNDVALGATGLTYCEGTDARQNLIDMYNWNITGDAEDCLIPFITTWKTNNPGNSDSTSITIPITGLEYNYNVDWENDGIYDTIGVSGSITHDYGATGTYQVAIRGNFPRIYFNNGGDKDKILSIDQWGEIEWSSMSSAFRGCSNLGYTAIDTPDLSLVTSMNNMFNRCTLFNGDISGWDVSNITGLRSTFNSASSFNQDIGNWDVTKVTDMEGTFTGATNFNQDISEWKVDSVATMYEMFAGASSFNQEIGGWMTGNVEDMEEIFKEASSFNQDISMWDLSSVSAIRSMFLDATSFNQDLSDWDVSHIESMSHLFSGATSFDQDLGDWDISNVVNMTGMLDSTNLSLQNYDNTLKKWAQGQYPNPTIQTNVTLGANGLEYCTSEGARFNLTRILDWTITGDQNNCSKCTTPTVNEWIGPAEGSWHTFSSWSQGTFPDICDLVIIPSGKIVNIDIGPSPIITMCHSIEIAQGGSLITVGQSELLISLGVMISEGESLRSVETK